LQPYCNVVAVTVVQQGAQYQLDGTDDQCGAGQRASVTGLAFLNPDGSIGFGLTIVTSPGGVPVQVDATIALASLSGTWRDSTGATGAFVFTPGTAVPGSGRPVPARGDVTAVAAGTGLTGGGTAGDVSLAVDFGATQQRVTGTCPAGQLMTGVNQNGTVACASVTGGAGGDITGITAGPGLTGGGTTGEVALAVSFGGPGSSANVARSDHTHAAGSSGSTAVGAGALLVATGLNNTAVGAFALNNTTTGFSNTAIGNRALLGATTGSVNTAVGQAALEGTTTGTRNVAFGNGTLTINQVGADNVAVGYLSLFTNSASENTAIGSEGLRDNTTGQRNVAAGAGALRSNTTGGDNTAVGWGALRANSSASNNTGVGGWALHNNTTGNSNVAVGGSALLLNTTGSLNVAVGASAMSSGSTASESVAIGTNALVYGNGTANVAVGAGAQGSRFSGDHNVAIGWHSLPGGTGHYNTAIGSVALHSSESGASNTAVGFSALRTVTTGTNNIAIGAHVGYGLTTGSNNIYLAADSVPAAESHTIRIGNTQTATDITGINGATSSGGVGVFVNASGQLGTLTSSARFKDHVTPLGDTVRERVQSLTPVRFVYKPEFDDGSRQVQYGLIAEEVAERFHELLVKDADGRPQTVRYHLLAPVLLAEVQRLERERQAATRGRDEQAARLDAQEREIARLRALVESLVPARRAR
jgi:hypothetical protein